MDEKQDHLIYQRAFFDKNVDLFKMEIPADIVERSREIVRSIIPNEEARVLDVGTGTGAFLKYYLELGVASSNILGCDLSSEMLAEARKRFPQIQLWQGDILNLPESVGIFNVAIFNACFGNIFDQLSVLKKTRTLLDKQGRIAITHPMGNDFVRKLKKSYPDLVHTLLPSDELLREWADELKMELVQFRDEANLYIALLQSC